ncbi:hypothetical protein IAU59_000279 [Kwoniella sp. CBS 9459]
MASSTCTPLRPPVLAPIITSGPSQSSFRLSSASATSRATSTSVSSGSVRPYRDSTCSSNSDWSCSTGLVTPRGDEKAANDFYVGGTEYLELGTKETWWMSTPKTPSSSKSQAERRFRVLESPTLHASACHGIPLAESPTLPAHEVVSPLAESPTLPPTLNTRDEIPLDDSPTLPSTSRAGSSSDVPSLYLGASIYEGQMSLKKLGKMPSRWGQDDWRENKEIECMARRSRRDGRIANRPFDLVGLLNEARHDEGTSNAPFPSAFAAGDAIFDVHLCRPLVSYPSSSSLSSSSSTTSSSLLGRGKPHIPSRTSSRPKPIPPVRGSSLRSLTSSSSSTRSADGSSSTSSAQISSNVAVRGSHRPAPVRNLSHPPLANLTQQRTASLKLKKRLSPTLLQPISETPKDLDLSPDGNWALRKPRRKLGQSKSTPNLRSEQTRDMTLKFKLRRSNSQSARPEANQSVDAAFVSFPTSRTDSDLGGQREGRASLSDIARSFIPRSAPAGPETALALDAPRKSPRQNALSSKGRSTSARRPSLLGLPEWSPKPSTARSISDSAIGINLALVPAYALPNSRAATLSRGRSTPSVSLDLPRSMMTSGTHGKPTSAHDDIFTSPLFSTPSPLSHVSNALPAPTKQVAADEVDREEDMMALLDAEKWDWPSPPFRITTHTPGLSTSGTLDSLITPLTPSEQGSDVGGSEDECWIHGEAEWMERSAAENRNTKRAGIFGRSDGVRPKAWRPLSVGSGSIRSLDIAL